MKRTLILGIAFSVLAGGALFAQDKISVKGGTKFAYALTSEMSMTQSMGGQDMTMETNADGTVQMMANKVGKDRIDWSYGISEMKLRTASEMLPDGGMDTTLSMDPVNFVSDMNGRIIESGEVDRAMQMLGSGMQALSVEQMFSPALTRTMKTGDSWEVKKLDTVQNPAMGGAAIVFDRTTRYTYEGTVDTLKMKAARIRSEITSMTISGSGQVMGMDMKVDGDGSASTTSYYSTKDGVLLASVGDTETSMRMAMSGQMEMMIPITMRMKSSLVRK